jgi:phosphoribosylaminoimidazole synthetase
MKGIIKGCKLANCKLVGGETAEMPGTYSSGKFDIAGFSVGLVEKHKILKGKIKKNDLILAIPSNGIHSNGYSLVRKLIRRKKININKNKFLKIELIKPTKIYVNEVLSLINKNILNGCANITGGGLKDNIKRIIPNNLCAEIDLNKINTLKIFKWLKNSGIEEKEMLKTFNCGVGFCLIINKKNMKKVKKYFSKKFQPYVIGKISKRPERVKINGKIKW